VAKRDALPSDSIISHAGPCNAYFVPAIVIDTASTTWPVPSQNTLIHNRNSRRKLLWHFHIRSPTALIPVAISARLSTFVSPVPRDAASAPPALSPVTRTTNNSSYSQSANFVVTAQPVPLPIRVRFISILKPRTRKTSMAKTLIGNSVAVEGRTMPSRSGRL
jgi:hypothetical protein